MAEKMKGVLAELKTHTKEGRLINSEIVFKPYCEWYIEPLRDGYAETKYDDVGVVIDEFGIDVAEKVVEGELVEVEREVPNGFRLVSCTIDPKVVKKASRIVYPWRDAMKEYLTREKE